MQNLDLRRQSKSAFGEAAKEGAYGIESAAQILGAANALSAGVGLDQEPSSSGGTDEAQRYFGSFPPRRGDRAEVGTNLSTDRAAA